MRNSNYETDFYGWANEQAALLRAGRLDAADIENIAEEIESMGKSEKRELISRLTVLLLHRLKWKYQPGGRGASWQASIKVQRAGIEDHFGDNASLKSHLAEALQRAYRTAVLEGVVETNLSESAFSASSPWTFDQIMEPDFWPE